MFRRQIGLEDRLEDQHRRHLRNAIPNRRDGFATTIKKAMEAKLGTNADEALELLKQRGFGKALAKHAIEIARQRGALTVFAVVDALTRLSANLKNAGDRAEADERAGRLLALAA